MNDSSPNPAGQPGPEPGTAAGQAAGPGATPPWHDRVDTFGQEVEAAANRLARDPRVQEPVDLVARAWGAIVLVVGLWFLADVTLRLDLPSVDWPNLWPVGLILLGGMVVLGGAFRRP